MVREGTLGVLFGRVLSAGHYARLYIENYYDLPWSD
jgi:hypothetical protein